ncbi:hypothetical protein M301_1850 [Methylotenera versatilis 301]|uniref:Uncharacterized protein n=1 Tax=Methylotenera versatilis (strain 301) TaxID=666681 RepID=D7DJI9_METV0|nr:hypothetical protein M301_1850 [Methylotenera versatilis 301]
MSLNCPRCKSAVGFLRFKESFICSHCSAKLIGNYNGAFIWTVGLSWLADLVIYPVVYSNFGSNWWPGVIIRIALSTSAFIGFLAILISSMGTIELSSKQD